MWQRVFGVEIVTKETDVILPRCHIYGHRNVTSDVVDIDMEPIGM